MAIPNFLIIEEVAIEDMLDIWGMKSIEKTTKEEGGEKNEQNKKKKEHNMRCWQLR